MKTYLLSLLLTTVLFGCATQRRSGFDAGDTATSITAKDSQALKTNAKKLWQTRHVKADLEKSIETWEKLSRTDKADKETFQGRNVKISNVTYRLMNTRGGYIGPNKTKVYEAFNDNNLSKAKEIKNPVGTSPKLYNVDLRVPLGSGYRKGGRMYYKQEDPLPVTISAVIPEVTIS
jgi:hypothetical protein